MANEKVKKTTVKKSPVKQPVVVEAKKEMEVKKNRKTFVGTVISDKMQKTVVVKIERKVQHPLYKKFMRENRKFKADTNGMDIKIGDTVKIEQTRKMSKDKNFKVVEKITLEGGAVKS